MVGPDGEALAFALLVGLAAPHPQHQAPRLGGDVADGERDDFRVELRRTEADQHHRAVACGEGRGSGVGRVSGGHGRQQTKRPSLL